MMAALLATLRWSLSLGAKFGRVVPGPTLFIIGLTLTSQVSMLLASLLPLKVVILLGSEHTPAYFPAFLNAFSHHAQIALLSFITVGFFILHLLSERLILWRTAAAIRKLLAMSEKMTLFEHQDDIARAAYQRFSHALASGVFIAISWAGLLVFYPAMMLVQLVYIVLVAALLAWLFRYSPAFYERMQDKTAPAMALASGAGFFMAFGWLVLDFILLSPPAVIVSIVSLLLTRQVMARAASIVNDLHSLSKQRSRLDALFFHGKALMPELTSVHDGIWALLQPEARQRWLPDLLHAVGLLDQASAPFTCHWQQVGPLNVGALNICIDGQSYLLRLYDTNRASWAQHEHDLLSSQVPGLPALTLTAFTQVGHYNCLICKLPPGENPELATIKEIEKQLRTQRMAASPPQSLIRDYQRSMPMLWQRLDVQLLECLQVTADLSERRTLLDTFMQRLPELQQLLRNLPLMVQAQDFGSDALVWRLSDGRCLSLFWGQWSLEPVGAGWPESEREFAHLPKAFAKAASERPELAAVPLEHVEAAALAFALERLCGRQRYTHAMKLLPRLLQRMAEPAA